MTTIKVRPNTSSPFVYAGSAPSYAYTQDLGAITAATPVTVTHNLGTFDVAVQIIEKDTAATGAAAGTVVDATVEVTSANAIDITFTNSAAANLYRVTVLASGGTDTGISANLIDAKGDLIAGSAADTAARLAVGTDDEVLMAASAEATGLAWGPDLRTWTPTVTGFTQGDGTVTGKYYRIGSLVFFWCKFEMGSTSEAATDSVNFTPPVAFVVEAPNSLDVTLKDANGSTYGGFGQLSGATGLIKAWRSNSSPHNAWAAMTTTTPFTWATGDYVTVSGYYTAA